MSITQTAKSAFKVAFPVIIAYVGIGLPCGIMESQIGYTWFMAFIMSMTFYSGAGQFMIPSMWLSGSPMASIIASVSFVNTRQLLYSTAFSPYFQKVRKWLTFLFAATVTDESFGLNLNEFQHGDWRPAQATLVNIFCMTSWGVCNAIGVIIGDALSIPTAIAAFAMTSIFICLLIDQEMNKTNVVVIVATVLAVCLFKVVGLSGPAILLGALVGVGSGMAYRQVSAK